MNKRLTLLALIGIVGSIFFFNFIRKTKTTAFLEARNESCKELENNINKIYAENQTVNYNTSVNIESCDCYYARDTPDKEIEKKSINYCTCTCKTNEGNVTVNVRQSP